MDARVILMYDPSGYQTESRFFDRRRSVGRWWVEEWVGRFLGLVVSHECMVLIVSGLAFIPICIIGLGCWKMVGRIPRAALLSGGSVLSVWNKI